MVAAPVRNSQGWTMLDLIVSMGIAAILTMIAAPNFDHYRRSNEVYSDRKNINSAIMAARYEAVARNKTVTICPSKNTTSCSSDWKDGWLVFQDDGAGSGTARDGLLNGDESILKAVTYHGNSNFSVIDITDADNQLVYLSFNEYGRPAVSGKQTNRPVLVTVCDGSNDAKYARGLMLIGTGRVLQTVDSNSDGIHESRFSDGTRSLSFNSPLSCE